MPSSSTRAPIGSSALIRSWIAWATVSGIVPSAVLRGRVRRGVLGSAASDCALGVIGRLVAPRLSARRPSWSVHGRSGARLIKSVSEARSVLGEVAAR
jgi:uncharacterized membrane protein YeaQ/YmgE (transglycosylase-associated protein family)